MKARKILSAIMAIAMIAVFAVSVSAADGVREVDTYEKLAEALESGGEIKLIANITDARMATVPQGVSAVLDLNGYSISTAHQSGDTTKHEYAIDNLGTLTIKDSSAEKTGEINARGVYNGYNNSTNHIVTAKLVIDGAKIVNLDSNGGACLWGVWRRYHC